MDKQTLIKDLKGCLTFFQNSTSCLDDSDASFRPAETSLTTAEQIAHIAQSVDWFVDGAFSDKGFDMDFEGHWKDILGIGSLTEAKERVEKSFARAIEIIGQKSEEELKAPIAEGPIMGGEPRWSIVGGIVDHTAHHRGALTVYARLNGKTPQMPYQA